MNDTQKPFVCTINGCEMTFANEDHLNYHHKKHDMVLNLGITSKSAEVDQTPTPTRFIRNCEEVGLFQDLQNVNPFDETFKKAIEYTKGGTLLQVLTESNDDTLHTPHIFPQVDTAGEKYTSPQDKTPTSQSNEFCIGNLPLPSTENVNISESYGLTIVTDDAADEGGKDTDESGHLSLKNKLKETLINKKNKNAIIQHSVIITPALQIFKSIDGDKRKAIPENNENLKKLKTGQNSNDPKAKLREINRVAQLRCRKRKQLQWKRMEHDLQSLKIENSKLSQENQILKEKIYAVKEFLVEHKNGNFQSEAGRESAILSGIEVLLNFSAATTEKPLKNNVNEDKLPISSLATSVPIPVIRTKGQSNQKPVLIQVLGPMTQFSVSVLPHKS